MRWVKSVVLILATTIGSAACVDPLLDPVSRGPVSDDETAAADSALISTSGIWREIKRGQYQLNDRDQFSRKVPVDIDVHRVEVVPEHARTRYLLEMASRPVDATTYANNAGDVVVGLRLSNRRGSEGILDGATAAVDAGFVTAGASNVGGSARYIPMLIDVGNPVVINTAGSPATIDNYAAIVVTNQSIQPAGGESPVHVSRAVLQQWEGAPDTGDPEHVIIDKKVVASFLNDTVEVGDNIELGANKSSGGYLQMSGGGEPPPAPPNAARFKFEPSSKTTQVSVDASPYRPLGAPLVAFRPYDPPPRDYPTGETVVFESRPGDSGIYRGLSAFDPHSFRLPPRVAVPGGYLVAGIRIVVSSGSSTLIKTNQTDSDLDFGRDGLFIALDSHWVTAIQFVVENNTGLFQANQDVGTFIQESSVL